MNVNTIVISQEEAQAKLEQYERILEKKRVPEDEKLQSLYKAVSKGARVLNVLHAFQKVGVNELKQPKLAIARADWKEVWFNREWRSTGDFHLRFRDRMELRHRASNIVIPASFKPSEISDKRLQSSVPHIPPDVRPKYGLHNYHILFEVEEWKTYPVDPFLMRRISGMLFVVEAEWELTPLEASLLESMQTGN